MRRPHSLLHKHLYVHQLRPSGFSVVSRRYSHIPYCNTPKCSFSPTKLAGNGEVKQLVDNLNEYHLNLEDHRSALFLISPCTFLARFTFAGMTCDRSCMFHRGLWRSPKIKVRLVRAIRTGDFYDRNLGSPRLTEAISLQDDTWIIHPNMAWQHDRFYPRFSNNTKFWGLVGKIWYLFLCRNTAALLVHTQFLEQKKGSCDRPIWLG